MKRLDPAIVRARRNEYMRVYNKGYRDTDKYRAYQRDYQKQRRASLSPEKKRALWIHCHLKRSYGMTLEQFDAMLVAQAGRCALCKELFSELAPRRNRQTIHVDHDHATGRVRGLLCVNCNLGIGYFNENVERLRKAIDYLAKHT